MFSLNLFLIFGHRNSYHFNHVHIYSSLVLSMFVFMSLETLDAFSSLPVLAPALTATTLL